MLAVWPMTRLPLTRNGGAKLGVSHLAALPQLHQRAGALLARDVDIVARPPPRARGGRTRRVPGSPPSSRARRPWPVSRLPRTPTLDPLAPTGNAGIAMRPYRKTWSRRAPYEGDGRAASGRPATGAADPAKESRKWTSHPLAPSRPPRDPPSGSPARSASIRYLRSRSPARAAGNTVTFEPGARTAWHTHPLGQILIVTAGLGRVQRWDGPVEDDPAGRRGALRAGREALARRRARRRDDPHRHPGSPRRKGRRVDGARQRRAVRAAA